MRFALVLLLLSACGSHHKKDRDEVFFHTYENPRENWLGLTYGPDGDGYYHSGIVRSLESEPDQDKPTRVSVHELLNTPMLKDGRRPAGEVWGWYVTDSDTLPPFSPIRPDEAAWISTHRPIRVHILDDWLREYVRAAIARINAAVPGAYVED